MGLCMKFVKVKNFAITYHIFYAQSIGEAGKRKEKTLWAEPEAQQKILCLAMSVI